MHRSLDHTFGSYNENQEETRAQENVSVAIRNTIPLHIILSDVRAMCVCSSHNLPDSSALLIK